MTETNEIVFMKPGLGVGGASYADIDLAAYLMYRGEQVSFMAGYIHASAQELLDEIGIPYKVDPMLDRGNLPTKSDIANVVGSISSRSMVIIIQAFCEREQNFASTAVAISQEYPTTIRLHDPVAPKQEAYVRELGRPTKVLALTRIMAAHTLQINPTLEGIVLPPLHDLERFDNSLANADSIRKRIRDNLGIGEDDILLFQPTRGSLRKGLDYSALLAARLTAEQDRKVHLVVAGSDSTASQSDNLTEEAVSRQNLVFENIIFLNNTFEGGHRRIPDYIVACDLVMCPSTIEGFGNGTAEAALCGKPSVTRDYVDTFGEPVFKEVYGDFHVIKDPVSVLEPSNEVFDEVISFLDNPQAWRSHLKHNRELAVRFYTQQSLDQDPRIVNQFLHRL